MPVRAFIILSLRILAVYPAVMFPGLTLTSIAKRVRKRCPSLDESVQGSSLNALSMIKDGMSRLQNETNQRQWLEECRSSIRDLPALERELRPDQEEKAFFSEPSPDRLDFLVTRHYLSLAQKDATGGIRRQCIPRCEELEPKPYELDDPLGEKAFSPLSRLIHRYRDRCLILVTDMCFMYCRHCFRRSFTGKRQGPVSMEQLERMVRYISQHREIREILLSGGDPLTLADERLFAVFETLRALPRRPVIRLATRAPVVLPSRITPALISGLARYGPLWVVTQFNHPGEISRKSEEVVRRIIGAGIPVLNQTVLLRGVNDRTETLKELFHGLVELGVKPYYLFQGDLARGTFHLRVPLHQGLDLVKRLRNGISGLAMPVYAVDLPGGGGKISLTPSSLFREEDDLFVFLSSEGREYQYPKE